MKPTPLIGLFPVHGDGQQNRCATRLKCGTSIQTCSRSNFSHAPDFNVVSLPLYKAQRRRAQALAAQDARRRCVIQLFAALMIGFGLAAAQYTIHAESQLQQRERW
jgi:hypothetical protein